MIKLIQKLQYWNLAFVFVVIFSSSLVFLVSSRHGNVTQDISEKIEKRIEREVIDINIVARSFEPTSDITAIEYRQAVNTILDQFQSVKVMLITSESNMSFGVTDDLFGLSNTISQEVELSEEIIRRVEPRTPRLARFIGHNIFDLFDHDDQFDNLRAMQRFIIPKPEAQANFNAKLFVRQIIRLAPTDSSKESGHVDDGNIRCYLIAGIDIQAAADHINQSDSYKNAVAKVWPENVPAEVDSPGYLWVTSELAFENLPITGVVYLAATPTVMEVSQSLFFASSISLALWVIGLSISSRKRSLNALQQRLELATETALMGIWEHNLLTNKIVWNPLMYELYGVDHQDEPIHEDWLECVHHEDRDRIRQKLQQTLDGVSIFNTEYRIVMPNGEIRYIRTRCDFIKDHQHEVTRILTVNWDVTDTATAFEAMIESQRVARLGNWSYDLKSGDVRWSDQLYDLFNRNPKLGPPDFETAVGYYDDESGKIVCDALERSANDGQPFSEILKLREVNNGVKYIRSVGRVRLDESNKVIAMYGTAADVTESVETQLELTLAKEQAEAANQAKSDFLANMSHEIRTPMNAILGFADLMDDGELTVLERRDYLQTVKRNGNHLMNIINDILDLSKIEAGKMTIENIATNPNDTIADITSLLRHRAESKGLILEVDFRNRLPDLVLTDPVRLKQILLNLLGNAIKFTEKGSVKLLLSQEKSSDNAFALLRFDVIDTGIGISDEQMNNLFKPFSQADASMTRRFGGTGLGLTLSRRFAQMLNGDITVKSKVPEGSCFTLTIKAELVHADAVKDTRDSSLALSTQAQLTSLDKSAGDKLSARVLLAEDGPDNKRLVMFHLKKIGLAAEHAENGKIAYEMALEQQSQDDPFDVILMDMQMPIMDGYAATQKLREDGYTGLIIALTAHAMQGDRERCIAAGCDEYMTKPIDRAKLESVIHSLLNQKRAA